jgi:arsenite methyltransferase
MIIIEEHISVIDELPLWSGPFGLRLLDALRMTGVTRILDFGSGLGFPVCEIAMRFGDGVQVVGIDPWGEALRRLALKRRVCEIDNLDIVRGIAERLPFRNGSFDLIVSNNGINNVQDLDRTLTECRRVAADGAQFVCSMNLDGTMREFYDVYEKVLRSRGLEAEIRAMHAHIRAKRPPLDFVMERLRHAGFRLPETAQDSFRYRFRSGTAMLRHFLIRLAFLDTWREILAPESRDEIFKEIEVRLNRIAEDRGEINLTIPFVTIRCEC